ncbi:hypothetical protein T07_8901 [Trichinella nelsoni]|uniref:Uncharacterized protein n=1 Tax=Trichinella nelsoni TaxID=6336 RepID=A0A0V0RRA0_9BILA|nr:hypothetical protein T07_8901 [Trichinella nelsoni]
MKIRSVTNSLHFCGSTSPTYCITGVYGTSAISIYVSPFTSVLRSIECQHAFTFHLQISVLPNTQYVEYGKVKIFLQYSVKMQFKIKIMKIILIAKSPIKCYKVADQSEQDKNPNNMKSILQ